MTGFKDSLKQIFAQVFGRADFAEVLEDRWEYSETFEGEVVVGSMPSKDQQGRQERPTKLVAPTQPMASSPDETEPLSASVPSAESPVSRTIALSETIEQAGPPDDDFAAFEEAPETVESLPSIQDTGGDGLVQSTVEDAPEENTVEDVLKTSNLIAQIAFDGPMGTYPGPDEGVSVVSGQMDSLAPEQGLAEIVAGVQTTAVLDNETPTAQVTAGAPSPLLLVKKEPAGGAPLVLKKSDHEEDSIRRTTRSGRTIAPEENADTQPIVRSARTNSPTLIEEVQEHAPLTSYDYGVKAPPAHDDLGSVLRDRLLDSLQSDLDRLGSHAEEVIVELLIESLENPTVDLPPFPAAASRLLGSGGKGAPDDDDILDIVKSDPGLAGSVIKAANSPFYMAAAPVASLGSSVVRIGLKEVRRVALAAAMASTFEVQGFEPLIDTAHIHSLTTGTSAEAFSKTFTTEPGVAFLSGLLHDAGELLVYRLLRQAYGKGPMERAPWNGKLHFVREVAQKYHCYLGAMFVQPWDLPPELEASLVYHHHPYLAGETSEEIASLIHVANATAEIAIRHSRSKLWQDYLARLKERRAQSNNTSLAGVAGIDGIEQLPVAEILEMLPPGFPKERIRKIIREVLLRVAATSLGSHHDDATTLTQH